MNKSNEAIQAILQSKRRLSLWKVILYEYNVRKTDKDCWECKGSKQTGGYGRIVIDGVHVLAHKLSYCLHTKSLLPSGIVIRHKCDNRKCINPLHLTEGTHRDNVHDAIDRGRKKGRYMTEEKLKLALSLRKEGLSYRAIGEIVDLGYQTVHNNLSKLEGT